MSKPNQEQGKTQAPTPTPTPTQETTKTASTQTTLEEANRNLAEGDSENPNAINDAIGKKVHDATESGQTANTRQVQAAQEERRGGASVPTEPMMAMANSMGMPAQDMIAASQGQIVTKESQRLAYETGQAGPVEGTEEYDALRKEAEASKPKPAEETKPEAKKK